MTRLTGLLKTRLPGHVRLDEIDQVEDRSLTRENALSHRKISLWLLSLLTGMLSVVTADDAVRVHGDTKRLNSQLYRSAEIDPNRLLAAARRSFQQGDSQAGLDLIRAILCLPADQFTDAEGTQPPRSAYQSAQELLSQQPIRVQNQWDSIAEAEADQVLNAALQDGDERSLMTLVRTWPRTRIGQQAFVFQIALAMSRGEHQYAAALVDLAEPMGYTAGPLTKRISRQQQTARVTNGGQQQVQPAKLSHPAPDPLWNWSEPIWQETRLVSSAAGLTQPKLGPVLQDNMWQAQLTDELVIVRTPIRIIALNKHSGEPVWSLKTDTVPTREESRDSFADSSSAVSPSDLVQMSELGQISVHENCLYFYDSFRPLKSPLNRHLKNIRVQSEASNRPTRLICLKLSPQPEIIWVAGTGPEFEYELQKFTPSGPLTVTRLKQPKSESVPREYRGLPAVSGRHVFTFSSDNETFQINCVNRKTGQPLWQQPVSFPSENTEGLPETGICAVDGDVVIAVLTSGLAVGMHRSTGQLIWASSPPNSASRPNMPQLRRFNSHPFEPRVIPGRLIWSPPSSQILHCINTQTGKTIWKTPRRPVNSEALEGSYDAYCLWHDKEKILLAGPRHLRAVRATDGQTIWQTNVPAQTGKGVATGRTCLLPTDQGGCTVLSTQTGDVIPMLHELPGAGLRGGLSSDGEIICAVTPTTIQAFETADSKLSSTELLVPSLRHSQLLWLAGRQDEAIDELIRISDSQSQYAVKAGHIAAEALLGRLAAQRLSRHTAIADLMPDPRLEKLSLSHKQSLRLRLITAAEVPDHDNQLVQLLPGWRIRADVASHELNNLTPPETSAMSIRWCETKMLRRLNTAEALASAQAARSRWPEAAESILLNSMAPNDETARLLNEIRGLSVIPGPEPEPLPEHLSITFTQDALLHSPSELPALLSDSTDLPVTPPWYSDQLIVARSASLVTNPNSDKSRRVDVEFLKRQTGIHRVKADIGAIVEPSVLPETMTVADAESGSTVPGLLPMFDLKSVGMLSLLHSDAPRILWKRRLPVSASELTPVILGKLRPSSLTLLAGNSMFCLHPLTGSILWHRTLPSAASADNYLSQQPYIFGDDEVSGVLGIVSHHCVVYATQTGAMLNLLPVQVDPFVIPTSDGSRLLVRRHQHLETRSIHLIDIRTGRDLLNGSDLAETASSELTLLPGHRAILLTPQNKLTVFNTQTGEITFSRDVSDRLSPNHGRSVTAVCRDQLIFAAIGSVRAQDTMYLSDARYTFDRLAGGTLFCIDDARRELRWDQPTIACQMPVVSGDRSNLILTWSWLDPNIPLVRQKLPPNLRDRRFRSLRIDIRRADTGKLVGSHDSLTPREPLLVRHDAGTRRFHLETDRSTVTIGYALEESRSR